MSSGRRAFRKHLARIGQLFIAALLFGTAFPQQASAQILNFSPGASLIDNDANQGSPTLIVFNGELVLYYVNHSTNTVYVDPGLRGSPEPVNGVHGAIAVWSAEITDVGATVIYPCGSSICPIVLISYVDPNQEVNFATSNDGVNFGTDTIPTSSDLGIGNQGAYPQLVPAVTSSVQPGQPAYVATIGADHFVYISSTFDGIHFTSLYANGTRIAGYTTLSRPSLTYWPAQAETLVAFTSNNSGSRTAVVGPVNGGPGHPSPARGDISWGNNNRNGNYAGISLIVHNGYIYIFGQDTASSQNIKYIYSADDSNWGGPEWPGNQMRWTPTLTNFGNMPLVWLAYQDDGNTNISRRTSSN